MKTPFSLHKTEITAPATGLLLVSDVAAEVLGLCVQLGAEAGPRVHAVPGGFLLKLARPATAVFPHTVRLRELAPNLFLPVDAELVPTLFPDEAAGLVRSRGLVFLPGGRVLGFDPGQPLSLSAFLGAPRLERGRWRPLPDRPALADRLRELLLDRPEESAEDVFATGGEGIGEEQQPPPPATPGARPAAHLRRGLGNTLGWLGRLLGWQRLARAGGEMARSALQRLRQLSRSVLDRQEAALRELLRQFQDGDLERALRRALPLGGLGDRGGQLAGNADLPTHDTRWSLGSVLGDNRGPGSLWMGGADLQNQLAAEYRKAAEAATARGDYRRAAFIYGRLLRDYRLAADVLSRGGLHHDAALLYLEKLKDNMAAARAFAAAGEIDRAVQLYRAAGAHVQAGDLLRQAGEEEQAVAEFLLAADQLRKTRQHYSAGELLLNKTGRVEPALECFRQGWEGRPLGGAVPCLLRMAQLYADRPASSDLLALLDEGEQFFGRAGSEPDAASFFNEVARLADRPNLAALQDRLRDRALLGLAGKLRQRAGVEHRSGTLVSTLFGQSGLWAPAQVSDAEAAFKATIQTRKVQKRTASARPVVQLRLHEGLVTAACAAPDTGRLFVAFADGALAPFSPEKGSSLILPFSPHPVVDLSADREGGLLTMLRELPDGDSEVVNYLCLDELSYILQPGRHLRGLDGPLRLTPLVRDGDEPVVGVWNQETVLILKGQQLVPTGRIELLEAPGATWGVLLTGTPNGWRALVLDPLRARLFPRPPEGPGGVGLQWNAAPLETSLSGQVFWASAHSDRLHVEIARVSTEGGNLYWARLLLQGNRCLHQGSAASKTGRYLGTALMMPSGLAAVREGGVDFLHLQGSQLTVTATTEVNLGGALGCFFSPLTGEVLVVCRDGYLVRVPVPQ